MTASPPPPVPPLVQALRDVCEMLCYFTPALVVLLNAVGLSAMIGYLDAVLLPALTAFLGLTGYAL